MIPASTLGAAPASSMSALCGTRGVEWDWPIAFFDMEGFEVENATEQCPSVRDICHDEGGGRFPDIPECPGGSEGLCEGVVFVECSGEDDECT